MADRSYQGDTAGEQPSPSELVKSMAISSAELWHEILDRLTQVQQSQAALARSIDDLGSIIKNALPSLAEATSTTQTLPPPAAQQAQVPTLPPSLAPMSPQAGTTSMVQPPSVAGSSVSSPTIHPGAIPGAPSGGTLTNPFLSQTPPRGPSTPGTPPIAPPGSGMPPMPPGTPPVAPPGAPQSPRTPQATAPQRIAPPAAGTPSSPTEAPEPLFFVPPLVNQAQDAGELPAAMPPKAAPPSPVAASPTTAPPSTPTTGTGSIPPMPAPAQPTPSQTGAQKDAIVPPPSVPSMPSAPPLMSLPGDTHTQPSATPAKHAEPINVIQGDSDDALNAILAAEFSDSGSTAGGSLATSTASAITKQPIPQIAEEAQLDSLLGKEFSATSTGTGTAPVPTTTESPTPPASIPATQLGFQVSPASILAESPRQQVPSSTQSPASPSPAEHTQGFPHPQVPHLNAPPPMVPMPAYAPVPEAPPPVEEEKPKSVAESLPKIERPVIQPLPATPGMPPPAMGFEIPEPMLGGLAGQSSSASDSDTFSMASQILDAAPEVPEEEEQKEAPIAEDIVLGSKHKKASRFFRL